MKNLLFKLFFLIFLFLVLGSSSKSVCQDSSDLKVGCPVLDGPRASGAYLLKSNDGEYKIRVTFMESTNGLLSQSECNQVMTILQNAYSPYGIHFIWDKEIKEYNSSINDLFHAININVNSLSINGGGAYTTPSTVIAIAKGQLFSPVIVHEMGHCLGLLHTHNSGNDDSNTSNTFTCEELVIPTNSTNCATCGDCLCETDPTTNTNYSSIDENGNCQYSTTATDSQGNEIAPNEDSWKNYMSYSHGDIFEFDCRDRFVPSQITRMKNIIEYSTFLDRVRIYDNFSDIPSTHDLICLNIGNNILIDDNIQLEANTSTNLIGDSEIAVFGNYEIKVSENALVEIFNMEIYNPIDDDWKGFKVRGNETQDTDTGLFLNGCTVRGAKTGISQIILTQDFSEVILLLRVQALLIVREV